MKKHSLSLAFLSVICLCATTAGPYFGGLIGESADHVPVLWDIFQRHTEMKSDLITTANITYSYLQVY